MCNLQTDEYCIVQLKEDKNQDTISVASGCSTEYGNILDL